jgi:dolichol-phosphate mannosyltransferase
MCIKETVICVPTYNEARNLPQITADILNAVPDASLLIIDDNSPDGTGRIADRLAYADSRISVLHRFRKEGLGKAYLDGFQRILNMNHIRLVGQMDADFSHPPNRLPAMIQATEKAELVIGSRYVSGGNTENWNAVRRMISRFGSLYARLWLNIPIRDITGGFKIWRREMLEQVLAYSISSDGYSFQIETNYLAFRLKARIAELPIAFTDRYIGQSKMTPGIAFEACWRLPLMRWGYRGVMRDA